MRENGASREGEDEWFPPGSGRQQREGSVFLGFPEGPRGGGGDGVWEYIECLLLMLCIISEITRFRANKCLTSKCSIIKAQSQSMDYVQRYTPCTTVVVCQL